MRRGPNLSIVRPPLCLFTTEMRCDDAPDQEAAARRSGVAKAAAPISRAPSDASSSKEASGSSCPWFVRWAALGACGALLAWIAASVVITRAQTHARGFDAGGDGDFSPLWLTWEDCGGTDAHGRITDVQITYTHSGGAVAPSGTFPVGSNITVTVTSEPSIETPARATFVLTIETWPMSVTIPGHICEQQGIVLPFGMGGIHWPGSVCPRKAGRYTDAVTVLTPKLLPFPPWVRTSQTTSVARVWAEDGVQLTCLRVILHYDVDRPARLAAAQSASRARDASLVVLNEGEDCYAECGGHGGDCPDFCGSGGACCRGGEFSGEGCPARAAERSYHTCVQAVRSSGAPGSRPHHVDAAAGKDEQAEQDLGAMVDEATGAVGGAMEASFESVGSGFYAVEGTLDGAAEAAASLLGGRRRE